MYLATVLCSVLLALTIQTATPIPIVKQGLTLESPTQPVASQFDPSQRAAAEEFLEANGVTGDEIEEYHRMSGFSPPADAEMGDERTLGLYYKIKYWNQNMYYRFRQWIESRRQTTTTHRPVIIINHYGPPNHYKIHTT